jgi:hypothetical protein
MSDQNPYAAPKEYGPPPEDYAPIPEPDPRRRGFEPFYLWLPILAGSGSAIGRVTATELFGDRAVILIIIFRITGFCLGAAIFALLLYGRRVRAEERLEDLE